MKTVTYTIKFNPQTGSKRPYEVWVTSDVVGHKVCSSCATLEGAEKSRQGYAKPRMQFFNVITPEFAV
jgi:hypothetical protein